MDFNLSREDIVLAAYRVSWPAAAPRPSRRKILRRSARKVLNFCRRRHFHGWAIPLSAPAHLA